MTSQLIILGNGFDLQCGLKSSYKDFFRSAILDTYSEHCGFPTIKKDCNGFWESLLFHYYIENIYADYKWCDIESIIKDTLLRIYFVDEQTSMKIWKNALESVKLKRHPDEEIQNLHGSVIKYLYKYFMRFFYDNLSPRQTYSDDEIITLLLNHLLKELHSFERRFCKYIKDNLVNRQNGERNTEYIVNAVNLLAKITEFSAGDFTNIDDFMHQEEEEFEEDISPNQSIISSRQINVLHGFSNLKPAHILSFNYTNIFDILGVYSPCLYSNVHGKLCSENCQENCNVSNIIFGIDDNIIQSKNENTELRLFSKTYRKMFDTNMPKSILPPNNDSPIVIKFYGHSLSQADYSYFQSIFDYYNLYSNNNVSLVFYYSEGYEQTDAIYRLINEYGKTLSNKEQGKNLIHKLLLENRLKICNIS